MTTVITGAAGFIGSQLSLRLLSKKKKVIGIDNLNNYYSVKLKKYRLKKPSILDFKYISGFVNE